MIPLPLVARRCLTVAGWTLATVLVVWSAIAAKESRGLPALVGVRIDPLPTADVPGGGVDVTDLAQTPHAPPAATTDTPVSSATRARSYGTPKAADARAVQPLPRANPQVRWFDGRPVVPARQMWMTVTAYSPDARSCGDSADGITATLHHVTTNGHALVAADPRVLPYGSMLTIDGYDRGNIVPVLDCGGAIKGRRLDVLFPTHEEAKAWGVRRIKVTVWRYADGLPPTNPRAVRW